MDFVALDYFLSLHIFKKDRERHIRLVNLNLSDMNEEVREWGMTIRERKKFQNM